MAYLLNDGEMVFYLSQLNPLLARVFDEYALVGTRNNI